MSYFSSSITSHWQQIYAKCRKRVLFASLEKGKTISAGYCWEEKFKDTLWLHKILKEAKELNRKTTSNLETLWHFHVSTRFFGNNFEVFDFLKSLLHFNLVDDVFLEFPLCHISNYPSIRALFSYKSTKAYPLTSLNENKTKIY